MVIEKKSPNIKISPKLKGKALHKVKPMLATLYKEPFDSEDWVYEIKFDGYRAVAEINKNEVDLHSRNLNSFNTQFAPIYKALKRFNFEAILDGEIVIQNEEGKSDFQLLQNYQKTGEGNLIYYVFDILYYEGYNLTSLPLLERKNILQEILPESDSIFYSDHIENNGKDFFKLAQEKQLEGIIAKRKDSGYLIGKRSKDWLKLKTLLRQEAVIVGYTNPRGARKDLGALVLAVYEGDELVYIGHSGTGFNEKSLNDIKKKLEPYKIEKSPLKEKVKGSSNINWVKPKFVCEVNFSEWTQEGSMRHPVFMGLRKDKDVKEVTKEKPMEVKDMDDSKNSTDEAEEKSSKGKQGKDWVLSIEKKKLIITNPDKIYWPEDGYTKKDLVEYYLKAAPYILPYLKGRPESLLRHPNGINGQGFFQKNIGDTTPEWIETRVVHSDSGDKDINYMICNDKATLIYMANLGCIEINPWFSRLESLDNPDYMVIDLDPEEIEFDKVIETALAVKEVLDKAKAKSFVKTSGATGIHIYVPLKTKYDYDVSKDFAHVIANLANKLVPDFTSLERSPSKRKHKVYLDFLQNRRGQTLAAPYSVRPKPGATVATPLDWKEVKPGLHPSNFTIKNIFKRLEKRGDTFKGIFGPGIDIEKCINNLQK